MPSHCRLLIVHPEPSARAILASMLQSLGHRVEEEASAPSAARRLERCGADLILLGTRSGCNEAPGDILDFLAYLKRKHPGMPALVLCDDPRPERTREALNQGAASVLRFPMPASQLRAAVAQAIELGESLGASSMGSISHETNADPIEPDPRVTLEPREFFGEDPAFLRAVELAEAIAPTRAPVLLVGEPGTGKRLLARHLHRRSGRRAGPFVEVRAHEFQEPALELELFGRRGEAVGTADRPGKIALAEAGTLYLDDATSLSPALQARLTRLLRDGEYEPVDASTPERSDCRVVVSSPADLGPLVEQGRFRPELSYTLGVLTLKLPPLRQRRADIARLAEAFATQLASQQGEAAPGFSPEALRLMEAHDWPGNVNELRAVIQRATLLARGGRIGSHHLQFSDSHAIPARILPAPSRSGSSRSILPLKEALEAPEKELILEALRALSWNRQETARVLDINRTTLYKKMKKYGLLYDEPVWTN